MVYACHCYCGFCNSVVIILLYDNHHNQCVESYDTQCYQLCMDDCVYMLVLRNKSVLMISIVACVAVVLTCGISAAVNFKDIKKERLDSLFKFVLL